MNDCRNAHPRAVRFLPGLMPGRMRRVLLCARHGLYLLLTSLLLAACGGDNPAPAAVDPVAAPVSALPTNVTGASDAVVSTATTPGTTTNAPSDTTPAAGIATLAITPVATTVVAADATPDATPVSTPMAEAEVPTPTVPAPSPTPTFVPLEAEENTNCEMESNLDLVGYPSLEQRMGCALEPAIFEAVAINEFGPADQPTDRFMLWFSHEQNIYALLPDGTYEVHEDTWNEATDPTYPCNPVGGEEDSPPLPRRGFGKLWCSSEELQAVLGTVPREERLCQYSVLQRFERGRLLACFEDATIRYFRILDNGRWDLQVQ